MGIHQLLSPQAIAMQRTHGNEK